MYRNVDDIEALTGFDFFFFFFYVIENEVESNSNWSQWK